MKAISNRKTWAYVTGLICSGAFTIGLLFLFYRIGGFYPFGDKTVSWCDMNQQVVPLLNDFKDILSGRSSIFYSLENAGGMNFWGVFFFFLASPFSFLVVFVPKSSMLLFMNILTALKLGTCSITCCWYLLKHDTRPTFSVLLSALYALSGYSMMFYQNIIWLDCMYLFPLLILSFETLLSENKIIPYIAAMSAMMVVNYYIGYMVVLFTLLYFGSSLLTVSKQARQKAAVSFTAGSIAAAGITCVVWLPSFLQYLSSGRSSDLIQSLISADFLTNLGTTIPFFFPSAILIIIIVSGIFRQSKMTSPYTSFYWKLLLMMLPAVLIDPINRMWHTGNYQAYPLRYGFIVIFLLTALSAFELNDMDKKADTDTAGSGMVTGVLYPMLLIFLICLYAYFSRRYVTSHYTEMTHYTQSLWGNLESTQAQVVLLLLSSILFYFILLGFRKHFYHALIFSLMSLMLFSVDSYANVRTYMFSGDYLNHNYDYQQAVDLENFKAPLSDTKSFFRLKLYRKYFDINLLGSLGYPTLSHYTSLTSQDYMYAMKKLGYSSYWMEVGGYEGTDLSDAALSVAYQVEWLNSKTPLYQNQTYQVSTSGSYLPLGIPTSKDLSDTNDLTDLTRYDVQELLFDKLFPGQTSPLTSYEPTFLENVTMHKNVTGSYELMKTATGKTVLHYSIPVKGRQALYFDAFDRLSNAVTERINNSFCIYVNDLPLQEKSPTSLNNGIIDLGTFENETVNVDITLLQNVTLASYGVFGIDCDLLDKAVSAKLTLDLKENRDHRSFSSTYTAETDENVFLSLPYDKGVHVTVDGNSVPVSRAFMGFCQFSLTKGYHQIRVYYMTPGLKTGLLITVLFLALTLAAFLVPVLSRALERLRNSSLIQTASVIFVLALFILVILFVYLIPVVINIYGNM